MQEKNNNSHPLGICQKLFNFVNNLIGRSLYKRITLGNPLPQGSTQLRLGDSLRKGLGSVGEQQHLSSAKPNGEVMKVRYWDYENSTDDLGSEIGVLFKQSEELESWTPIDKLGSSVHAEQPQLQKGEKVSVSSSTDQIPRDKAIGQKEIPLLQANDISGGAPSKSQVQERIELQGKSTQGREPIFTNMVPSSGPKKSKESEEEEKNKRKGKNIATEKLTLAMVDEDTKANGTPRRLRPLLIAAPNINEKSEAFIKSKKEAMSRNLSMGPRTS